MASTSCFIIVSRNDIPIYEAEVGSAVKLIIFVDILASFFVSLTAHIIHTQLMLLHDSHNDDGIKSFFQEVHELYIKFLLNPLYFPGSRITSSHFDTKVQALARKYL
ncbi:hypothetical protein HHK36_026079 [Tetracentron sinense]|uniref:Trafficking protein particle complex subunit 2 n=1 Tax=Tetracentron sinense TaxID=13715 RepID=A0A834YI32_TETSI|nr:hypothetical protein HHK36_026079 [Tetracentron sinense]